MRTRSRSRRGPSSSPPSFRVSARTRSSASRSRWRVRCSGRARPERRHVILAGDVGGTKTLLGLFTAQNAAPELVLEESISSRAHGTFEEILEAFLAKHGRPMIEAACIAVAGPVIE